MVDIMPWKKRSPKQMVQLRSELDDLFNRFFEMLCLLIFFFLPFQYRISTLVHQ